MIEANHMFVAERFTFYLQDVSPNVKDLLLYYQSQDTIDVIEFDLPRLDKTNETIDIYYHGQVAALLDCMYRNKGRSKYMAYIDIDEVIVPRHPILNTWGKIINFINFASKKEICSYVFHAVFYARTNGGFPDSQKRRNFNFRTKERMNDVLNVTIRAKSIVNLSKAVIPGIHFVRRCVDSTEDVVEVPPTFGLLHHYRLPLTTDSFMDKFNDIIEKRVRSLPKL